MKNIQCAFACLLAVTGIAMPHVRARTHDAAITVTTYSDELNADGDCSLREAVRAANTDAAMDACPAGSGRDEIRLPAGTYLVNLGPAGVEDSNAAGDLDIDSDVIIMGSTLSPTIVSSAITPTDRILDVAAGARLTMIDLTLTGYANTCFPSCPEPLNGAAIRNAGTLDVLHAHFRQHEGFLGGAIYNAPGGRLTISASTFSENRAVDSFAAQFCDSVSHPAGGAIYSDGVITVTDSLFERNAASCAGGIVTSSDTATLVRVTARNNSSTAVIGNGMLDIRDSQIISNVERGRGAGIVSSGVAHILRTDIGENRADTVLGGLRSPSILGECAGMAILGTAYITQSTIYSNTSSYVSEGNLTSRGGGACVIGRAVIQASTFHGNAAQTGGGIYGGSGSRISIKNSTLHANTALTGGGIYMAGSALDLDASTISGTTGFTGSLLYNLSANGATSGTIWSGIGGDACAGNVAWIASAGHNIDRGTSCGLSAGTDLTSTNPGLGVFQPYTDSRTPYAPLLPGSPAIDAGLPISATGLFTEDQRRFPRIFGGPVTDIGAIEVIDTSTLRRQWLPSVGR